MNDFLIIGGGINGLLTARELLAAGVSVTLLERAQTGSEASWAGGGIVSPLYPWRYAAAITALASWAQAYYPRLAAELQSETGIDVEHRVAGLLMLDADDEARALQWAGSHTRGMHSLDEQTIYRYESALAPGFKRGLWMPEVAQVRNPRLCQALTRSLKQSPRMTLVENCEVTGMKTTGNRVTEVQVVYRESGRRDSFRAGQIVVTAGAWSGKLLGSLLPGLSIVPVKGQMLLFKLPKQPVKAVVLTRGRYLIPRRDGHLLAGSTLEFTDFDKSTTVQARQSLLASARSLLPMLGKLEPVAQWAGLRPGSADGIPFIGRLRDWHNVSINAGQYRNGLVLAPASARLLCDLLLRRTPIVDPQPYQPDRRVVMNREESA